MSEVSLWVGVRPVVSFQRKWWARACPLYAPVGADSTQRPRNTVSTPATRRGLCCQFDIITDFISWGPITTETFRADKLAEV